VVSALKRLPSGTVGLSKTLFQTKTKQMNKTQRFGVFSNLAFEACEDNSGNDDPHHGLL